MCTTQIDACLKTIKQIALLHPMHNILPPNARHVSTGFPTLDQMTGGLQTGDLIVVAARPGLGKTAFSASVAKHISLKEKLPVAWFPMEIEGTSKLDLSDLSAATRTLHEQHGQLGLVVVDYLQLMCDLKHDGESCATELSKILCGLKLLAKDLRCPVIVLSQVNRSVEVRRDKRPMLSDLREVGAIELHADVVMIVYRDNYYYRNSSRDPEVVEIIIAKNRRGPKGTVELAFNRSLAKFESLEGAPSASDSV